MKKEIMTGPKAAELAMYYNRKWHEVRNKGLHLAENTALRNKIKYTVWAIKLGYATIEKDPFQKKPGIVSVKFKNGGAVHIKKEYLENNRINLWYLDTEE